MSKTAAAYEINEREWTKNVIQLARTLGYLAVHFRPAQTLYGWRTPVQGDGEGWPDLILVRPPRFIVAELKTDSGKLRLDQELWLSVLRQVPGIETYVWRPSEIDEVGRILQGSV